jgi:hypothetical protein
MAIEGIVAITNRAVAADKASVPMSIDKAGRQIITLIAPRELMVDAATIIVASTVETTILLAGAAGVFHDLTNLIVANTSAVGTRVDFRSAAAGAVRFSLWAPPTDTVALPIDNPIMQAAAANHWTATCITAVTDIRIFAQAAKNL